MILAILVMRIARGVIVEQEKLDFSPPPPENDVFATPESVGTTLSYLLKKNIIAKDANIALHNWGEPLLNPHFKDILRTIREFNLSVAFSTNASMFVDISGEKLLDKCTRVTISISGNSQESYNMAHGFKFEKIFANILRLKNSFLEAGLKNSRHINLMIHLYRYNAHEVPAMIQFAKNQGMSYSITPAHFNSLETTFRYLENTLDHNILAKAQEELFLPSQEFIPDSIPEGSVCSQYDQLVISASGMLELCCAARLDRVDEIAIAPITSLSLQEIDTIRRNHATCKKCISYSIPYYDDRWGKHVKNIIGIYPPMYKRCAKRVLTFIGMYDFTKRCLKALLKL